MSTEQLIADAMALPLSDRVSLAQALWESIDAGLPTQMKVLPWSRLFVVTRSFRQVA
jgi:hypothetical protein